MNKKDGKITISEKKKKSFKKAFGILKGDFGEKNSSEYVGNLRKEWRE